MGLPGRHRRRPRGVPRRSACGSTSRATSTCRATGPVVLASNHVSFLDFLLVGLAARRSRRARAVPGPARRLAATRSRRPLMAAHAARPGGPRPRRRRRTCGPGPCSAQGEAVGIFPEAGVSTSYTVRALMPGAVALARGDRCAAAPVAIWGPQRILTAHRPVDLRRGRPVSLLVGTPLYVDPATDLREGTARLGARAAGDARRPPGAARCTSRAPGERAPVAPGPPRRCGAHAAQARRSSRCRRARSPRRGPGPPGDAGRLAARVVVAGRQREPPVLVSTGGAPGSQTRRACRR